MANAPVATPRGVLDENVLYFGDNGRCFCGRLACAGMSAFFSGIALDGFPVIAVTEAAAVEATDLSQFACEGCGCKPCPSCGAPMTKETGTIDEPVMTGHGKIERKARPGTFYGCSACEHCEEVARG